MEGKRIAPFPRGFACALPLMTFMPCRSRAPHERRVTRQPSSDFRPSYQKPARLSLLIFTVLSGAGPPDGVAAFRLRRSGVALPQRDLTRRPVPEVARQRFAVCRRRRGPGEVTRLASGLNWEKCRPGRCPGGPMRAGVATTANRGGDRPSDRRALGGCRLSCAVSLGKSGGLG
jgi:hypothetical protein